MNSKEIQSKDSSKLGMSECIMIAVGGMMGSSIFTLSGVTYGMAGPSAMLSWAFAGVILLLYAMSLAELATTFQTSGGIFIYPYKVLGKTVSFHSMCKLNTLKDIQEVMKHKIIVLDDLGVENIVNEYGNKIDAFSMIVDEAEKENKLLIITTNLNKKLLLEKYKPRSYDRLMSMCKLVIFKNNSSLR